MYAQGNLGPVYLLGTSGGSALVSTSTGLDPRGLTGLPSWEFAFGFATDEELAPGMFNDSFTVSLQSLDVPGQVAVYFVVDRSGLVIGPPTPGGIPLDPALISVTPVAFPDGLTGLTHRTAFHVLTPVPEPLANQRLNVYFDLFDNGNGVNSLAWASAVTVIPEPQTGVLLLLSFALGAAFAKRIRR